MKQYVGLDVSLKMTSVCVLDEAGLKVWSGRCPSTPVALSDVLKVHAPDAERVGMETGGLSVWLYHELVARGVPIVCIEARHAHSALSMQLNKTDPNDARGLAEVVRMGWFRAVHVKSPTAQRQRALLVARFQLLATKRDLVNLVRGILRNSGVLLPTRDELRFEALVREHLETRAELTAIVEPVLRAWCAVREEAARLDQRLRQEARTDGTVAQLMTTPGIGPITGFAYVATVDDPHRFRKSALLGAYLGLTPRRFQSGDMSWQGRISKRGDCLLRQYLCDAAGVLLSSVKRPSPLQTWGNQLRERVGRSKARIAVARKLAVLLHRMWITGEPFRWENASPSHTLDNLTSRAAARP